MSQDSAPEAVPPTWHGASLDLRERRTYSDFLELDSILHAQDAFAEDRNGILFVIQHQISELWMRLLLYELESAIAALREDKLRQAFKIFARIGRVFEQMVNAWSVLATMTPSEYVELRPRLGTSSGFQSFQYRAIEFRFGNKNRALLEAHRPVTSRYEVVKAALEQPSVYDEAIRLLARRGLAIDRAALERDPASPYVEDPSVMAAWIAVYRDPDRHFDLYELAEELIDMEEAFRLWRFRHVSTVERVIGFKRGTGGTAGVAYLRKMLDVVLFPELWKLRTEL